MVCEFYPNKAVMLKKDICIDLFNSEWIFNPCVKFFYNTLVICKVFVC